MFVYFWTAFELKWFAFFKHSSNDNNEDTTQQETDNFEEIEREAARVEQEIRMEAFRQELEECGIEKGQIDALENEKGNWCKYIK